jgi:hypothetical protein
VILSTLVPQGTLVNVIHSPKTSCSGPPDAGVWPPRSLHRPSPAAPEFVAFTRTHFVASTLAGQGAGFSTIISNADPPGAGVGPGDEAVHASRTAPAKTIPIANRC